MAFWFIEDKRKDGSYVLDFPDDVINQVGFQNFLKNEHVLFMAMHDPPTPHCNGIPASSGYMQVAINADQWTRFRCGFAVPLGQSTSFTIPAPCEAHLLAMDGMWLNNVPGPAMDTFSETNAGRLEIAVKCPSTITSTQFTWKTSSGNLPIDVTIKAPTSTKSTDTPFGPDGGPWQPIRPWHMETTLDGPVDRTITVQGAVNGIIWDGAAKSVNDVPFIPPVLFYDKLYEFVITHPVVPDGRIHPIHLHIYPMQIYGKIDPETGKPVVGDCSGGTNLNPYKHGEFYDTVLSPDQCIVRWRSRGMGGKVMLHCHMLAHEDGGAMIYVNVEGGPDSYGIVPPVEPITCPAE